jgi:hypothetical protein
MLTSVITVLAASYIGICILVFLTQGRMVYFPTADVHATPKQFGLAFEDLMLPCPSGGEINAWFVPAVKARGTVLFCHGNGGNIADRVETVDLLNRLGLNVLIFDYRGYGKSTGKPSEKHTYEDARVAWDYLVEGRAAAGREGTAPERIVVFGRSLGGSIAAHLAAQTSPGALVVESSFTSVPDMGARLYWWLPVRLIARYKYSTVDSIAKVHCPVLVAHSPEDEIVPYALGRRLFAAAPEPKEFFEMSGDHNEGWSYTGDRYAAGLDAFFTKILGPRRGAE